MAKFIKFASGVDSDHLELEIADMLDEGFELHGSPFTDINGFFYQGMIKETEGESSSEAYLNYQNEENKQEQHDAGEPIPVDTSKYAEEDFDLEELMKNQFGMSVGIFHKSPHHGNQKNDDESDDKGDDDDDDTKTDDSDDDESGPTGSGVGKSTFKPLK